MSHHARICVPMMLLLLGSLSCDTADSVLSVAMPLEDEPSVKRTAPIDSIGMIEHRGRFYRLEDLTDPDFVAQSDDPYVKCFALNNIHADVWIGSSRQLTPDAWAMPAMTSIGADSMRETVDFDGPFIVDWSEVHILNSQIPFKPNP